MLWDGNVRSECEDDEGSDCKDGDRIWHALCINCMKLRVEHFS
jgi:hypothetical protein